MEIIRKPYKYFGHQCNQCGCYFIYDGDDLAIGELACPNCHAPFTHSIETADVEPNITAMMTPDSTDNVVKEPFIPTFQPGEKCYCAYDTYYAKEGDGTHKWKVAGVPNEIERVEISLEYMKADVRYIFTDIVFKAHDQRQHCRESCHACIPFKTLEAAVMYVKMKESGKC